MTDEELRVYFENEDQIEDCEYKVLSEEECNMLWEVFLRNNVHKTMWMIPHLKKNF